MIRRLSVLALIAVLAFLLADLLRTVQDNQDLTRRLATTNEGIVGRLTQAFVASDAATEARIIESLKGFVAPALVQQAVEAAKAQRGATGATGARGPAGPAASTTSTVTTTTTPKQAVPPQDPYPTTSSSSTTSSSTTTTTARHCAVLLLGLCL